MQNNNLKSNSSFTQDKQNKDMIVGKKTENEGEKNIHLK